MVSDIHNQVHELLEKDIWEWVGRGGLFCHFIFVICFIGLSWVRDKPWILSFLKKGMILPVVLCIVFSAAIAFLDVFYKGKGFLKGIIRGLGLTELDEQNRHAIKAGMFLYIFSVLLITFIIIINEDLRGWIFLWVWWVVFLTYFMFWIQSNGTGVEWVDIGVVVFTLLYPIAGVIIGFTGWKNFIKFLIGLFKKVQSEAEKAEEDAAKLVVSTLSAEPQTGSQTGSQTAGSRRRR